MCIINNTHRFVFVHIPKCAGTSVTHALAKLTTYADLEIGGTDFGEALARLYGPRFKLYKHSRAVEIRAVVGSQVWSSYFTFTFVRNPYDRAISTFFFLKKNQQRLAYMKSFATPDDFILAKDWSDLGPDRMLDPQRAWLARHAPGEDLLVDYVGKVETIEQDFAQILDKVNVHPAFRADLMLERKNHADRRPDGAGLSPAALEKVAARYAVDFETFGYDPADVAAFAL